MTPILRGALPTVRWSAIFAGALCALAVDMALSMLGTGIGLSSVPAGPQGLGAGGAIWSVVTPVVAYFCGAYLAARMAGALRPASAHLHGIVTWGMGIVVSGALMAGPLAGALVGQVNATTGNGAALNGEQADTAAARAAAAAGLLGISGLLGLVGALIGAATGRNAVVDRGEAYHARIEREPLEAQGMAMGPQEPRRAMSPGPGGGDRRRVSMGPSPGIPERRHGAEPAGEGGRDLPSREGLPPETRWHD